MSITTSLRFPFKGYGSKRYEFIAVGGTGCIFSISANIVVKAALQFENPTDGHKHLAKCALEDFEYEKEVCKQLWTESHPNIVQGFLCTPNAIFMQRMSETLGARLAQQKERPISERLHHRWFKQIASATVWLEKLDYFHGDLRPPNILLDADDHVKLCDFGNATKRGQELIAVTDPYYRMLPDRQSPLAGPASEQFAVGSCVYTIRMGHEPLEHLDGLERIDALIRGEFPSTDSDCVFGSLTLSCWRGQYETMAQLEQALTSILKDCSCHEGSSVMESNVIEARTRECVKFMEEEGTPPTSDWYYATTSTGKLSTDSLAPAKMTAERMLGSA